jgi:hypothetical protein
MTQDATPGKKDEVHDRHVRRTFQPKAWLVVVAIFMAAVMATLIAIGFF